jgi:hypothetical protein
MEKPSKSPRKASAKKLKKTPSKKTTAGDKNTPKAKTTPRRKVSSGKTIRPKEDPVTAPIEAESQHRYFEDLGSRIVNRAYELYVQRGQEHGHDFEDWLEAEQKILPKEISERSLGRLITSCKG